MTLSLQEAADAVQLSEHPRQARVHKPTTPQDLTLSETMANPFSQHPQFQNEALGQSPVTENAFNGQDQIGQPLSPFADALRDSQDEPMGPLSRNLISLAMGSAYPASEPAQIPSYSLATSPIPESSALPIPDHSQVASSAPQGSILFPDQSQGASPVPQSSVSPFQNNF